VVGDRYDIRFRRRRVRGCERPRDEEHGGGEGPAHDGSSFDHVVVDHVEHTDGDHGHHLALDYGDDRDHSDDLAGDDRDHRHYHALDYCNHRDRHDDGRNHRYDDDVDSLERGNSSGRPVAVRDDFLPEQHHHGLRADRRWRQR
jgi:hypothetical protein